MVYATIHNHFSKSAVMWFRVSNCRQSPDPPATLIEGIPLSVVSKQCYLKLIFDDQLKWTSGLFMSERCEIQCHIYYLYLINKHCHMIKVDY